MMIIDNNFNIGNKVYLITDPDQHERMVIGINVRVGNHLIYEVAFGGIVSDHYEMEMSREMNTVKKFTSPKEDD